MDFVKRIYDFNKDNGLLEKGYNDFLESSFQIEEALEGFDSIRLTKLHRKIADPMLNFSEDYTSTAKTVSREILAHVSKSNTGNNNISDVDRLDKAVDAVVYAIGSMAKLGLNPDQINKAINIVMDANSAKTGCPKDEYGKLMKPENFPEPEPRLQELLNECNN